MGVSQRTVAPLGGQLAGDWGCLRAGARLCPCRVSPELFSWGSPRAWLAWAPASVSRTSVFLQGRSWVLHWDSHPPVGVQEMDSKCPQVGTLLG